MSIDRIEQVCRVVTVLSFAFYGTVVIILQRRWWKTTFDSLEEFLEFLKSRRATRNFGNDA